MDRLGSGRPPLPSRRDQRADRSVDVLDVAAAGLMLAAPEGGLRVMASSNEAIHVVELVEVQADEGPCLDCYRTGEPVTTADLAAEDDRWPRFAPVARHAGFRSVHAVPMRVRQSVIGALNLFNDVPGVLDDVARQVIDNTVTIPPRQS